MSIETNLLYNTLAGQRQSLVQTQAVNLLQSPNPLDQVRGYQILLEDEQESVRIRHQAIANLAKIDTPESQAILINHLQISDQRLQADVLKGLGRIGDRQALAEIERIQPQLTGLAAFNAQFAAALISHRLGLAGNDLPLPKPSDLLPLSVNEAQRFQLVSAEREEAQRCLDSLASQPFGIRYAPDSLQQIECGRNRWMLALNEEFARADAVDVMRSQKAFPGILALKNEENGGYATAFLILTTPTDQPDTLNVVIPRATGEIMFSGTGKIVEQRLEFAIASVSQPGTFPVDAQGVLENGSVQFSTALSATQVKTRRQPQKG